MQNYYLYLYPNDKFYTQRTATSKIIILNKNKEKENVLEDYPEEIQELLDELEQERFHPEDFFEWTEVDGGLKITDIKQSCKVIKIPEYIDEKPVVSIGEFTTFLNTDGTRCIPNVTQIILPSTLNEIEAATFNGYINLRSVYLPPSVKEIQPNTFINCHNLFDIDLSNVEKIRDFAFENCISLEVVDLKNITLLDFAAFQNCFNLRKINFSDKLTQIPDKAFARCTRLNHVILPEGIVKLGKHAFEH